MAARETAIATSVQLYKALEPTGNEAAFFDSDCSLPARPSSRNTPGAGSARKRRWDC